MDEQQPNYYGIIPATVRYDKNLTANAKLLFAEISALANMRGICWATNKYLAKLYGVQPNRISVWVKQLEDAGHIRTKTIAGGFRGISVVATPSGKTEGGVTQKRNHNNTVTNKSYVELEKSLLVLVNEITGRNFRTLPERGVKKTLDTFSLGEISLALRALAADDWHAERVKEFKIDYLIRATTIDKFLAIGKDVLGDDQAEKIKTQDERVRERMGGSDATN